MHTKCLDLTLVKKTKTYMVFEMMRMTMVKLRQMIRTQVTTISNQTHISNLILCCNINHKIIINKIGGHLEAHNTMQDTYMRIGKWEK